MREKAAKSVRLLIESMKKVVLNTLKRWQSTNVIETKKVQHLTWKYMVQRESLADLFKPEI